MMCIYYEHVCYFTLNGGVMSADHLYSLKIFFFNMDSLQLETQEPKPYLWGI